MGRPPCCENFGTKKGPWTPEEDIILASYIQKHGPGNWRAVPADTGLLRCSKSCRLRWTNYLRPGIKRGNFTSHEEGMIIHLQALLGNKWAAIASYLPQRTDNDIKNYWNTHLKKKLKKFQSGNLDPQMASDSTDCYQFMPNSYSQGKGLEDSSNHHLSGLSLRHDQNSAECGSNAENMSRLLEGWMGNTANSSYGKTPTDQFSDAYEGSAAEGVPADLDQMECGLSLDRNSTNGPGTPSCDPSKKYSGLSDEEKASFMHEKKPKIDDFNPPLSYLEKWLLLDENASQVELPQMF